MFTNQFLRAALLFVAASATGLSGMTCISGCQLPDRDYWLGKPPSIKASKGVFGASVEVSTAFSGEADLTPDGKLTHVSVNSDPVVVEQARAEAALKVSPLWDKWADYEMAKVQVFKEVLGDLMQMATFIIGQGGQPSAELFGAIDSVTRAAAAVDIPSPIGGDDAPSGPAVIVDGPE